MSSAAVRTAFRDSLQAQFPLVQYNETIAIRVDNNDLAPLWLSLEFLPGFTTAMCIGKPTLYREAGTVRVWCCGLAGEGDSKAVDLGDAVGQYYRGWTLGTLRVQSVSSPANGPESDGRWFMPYVDINYQFDFYV